MQTKAGFKALLNENNVVICDRTIEKICKVIQLDFFCVLSSARR